jgi:polysaccharide export outer membrane protein
MTNETPKMDRLTRGSGTKRLVLATASRAAGIVPMLKAAASAFLLVISANGCALTPPADHALPPTSQPSVPVARELEKVSLPPYVIEPPDILLVDALRVIPKDPFRIQPLDILYIEAEGTPEDAPIRGPYPVEPGGAVDLGSMYGKVDVAGKSLDEAADAVTAHLERILRAPQVSLTLFQSAGIQQISGEHLVAMDGTINLGVYGDVYVTGMTIPQATEAIREHLKQFVEDTLLSVDVLIYNSKVYYVITEGAGLGDNMVRLPITGNETVLDAVSQIQGLSRVSSKNIWIARPSPQTGCFQILPVKWDDVVLGGKAGTNYQILPGDRVFVQEDHLIAADALIAKITGPFERILGFSLLGANTVQTIQRFPGGFAQ